MRKLVLWLAFLSTLALALPALAQDADLEEEGEVAEEAEAAEEATEESAEAEEAEEAGEEEEEEEGALGEYGSTVGNRFLIGLNSLITFPADPVMSTVQPADEFDELPLSVVTRYPVGFVQGAMLMTHRASTGVLDMAFAPITPMKMLSPEPRYLVFPNAEHEEY